MGADLLRCLLVALAAALPSLQTAAQTRDPTLPPAEARLPATATASAHAASGVTSAADAEAASLQQALQHRTVLQGKPYLIERGWLRGVGDRLGGARIERITDTEVWLRDAQGLRKLALYPLVQIKSSTPPTPRRAGPAVQETSR